MSIKNTSKDRNCKGKIKRKYTGPYSCCFSVPSWYRRVCNRKFRSDNKNILIFNLNNPEKGREFKPFKKDCGYDYW